MKFVWIEDLLKMTPVHMSGSKGRKKTILFTFISTSEVLGSFLVIMVVVLKCKSLTLYFL